MASITIRHLDPALKARLRVRAARHGRSMEEEVREMLKSALSVEEAKPRTLLDAVRKRFGGVLPVELSVQARELLREPPDLKR